MKQLIVWCTPARRRFGRFEIQETGRLRPSRQGRIHSVSKPNTKPGRHHGQFNGTPIYHQFVAAEIVASRTAAMAAFGDNLNHDQTTRRQSGFRIPVPGRSPVSSLGSVRTASAVPAADRTLAKPLRERAGNHDVVTSVNRILGRCNHFFGGPFFAERLFESISPQ